MRALARFDRLEDLLADPFPDLLRRAMRRPDDPAMRSAVDIKVDVIETDQAYTVKAEIPRVRRAGAMAGHPAAFWATA